MRDSDQSDVLEPDPPPAVGRPPSRWRSAMMPLPRAGGFYARSWRDYVTRQGPDDLPIVRPTVALAGHAFLDEIVLAGFRTLLPDAGADARVTIRQETVQALQLFDRAGWLQRPEGYFSAPPELEEVTAEPGRFRGHSYERLSFVSGYEPAADEPGAARWQGYEANRRGWAWLLRHPEPRPWLVCIHGAVMGRPMIDLTLFRAQWLHTTLGLNVLLPVLPLHGPRRQGLGRAEAFPGENVMDDVHGTAQAVWDVRRLLSWIRTSDRQAPIGVTGISLGGYTTSLVASLEDGLACAIVGVPAVDLIDLIEHHSGVLSDEQRRSITTPAAQLGQMFSPLSLTPRVPLENRFIYAGLADRLVHPRDQLVRLWEHWGRPRIAWYAGGHTGFSRSKPVQRFLLAALVQSGLVDPMVALRAV